MNFCMSPPYTIHPSITLNVFLKVDGAVQESISAVTGRGTGYTRVTSQLQGLHIEIDNNSHQWELRVTN